MTKPVSFTEGKIHYYDGESEGFTSLDELLGLVFQREREKSLIRQVELLGREEGGESLQAVFDFNSLTTGSVEAEEAGVPGPRYQRMLGEILLEDGVVTDEQLEAALEEQKKGNGEERLGKVLQRLGFTTAREIYAALGKQYGIAEG